MSVLRRLFLVLAILATLLPPFSPATPARAAAPILLCVGASLPPSSAWAQPGTMYSPCFKSFADLQPALTEAGSLVASGSVEVWVAKGTYKPTTDPFSRSANFQLRSGVAIYGGFSGTGTEWDRSARNPAANVTTLSGDLNQPYNNTDNSYHVVYASGTDSTAVLDGFTITDGNNYYLSGGVGYGAGIYVGSASPTLVNLRLIGNQSNYGAGLAIDGGSPSLTNATIADSSGGNASVWVKNGATPRLTNVEISDNYNSGMGVSFASPVLTNVVIRTNHSWVWPGLYVEGTSSNPVLTNVTIAGNSSVQTYVIDGAVHIASGNVTLTNCIVWGNTTHGPQIFVNAPAGSVAVTYSDVQDGYAGDGNINADPKFASSTDLRLKTGSPAVDAGNSAPFALGGAAYGVINDLLGNPRIVDDPDVDNTGSGLSPFVDLGAYEGAVPDRTPPTVTTTNLTGSGTTTGSSYIGFSVPTNSNPTLTWHADEAGSYELRKDATDCTTGSLISSGSYVSGDVNSTVDISNSTTWPEGSHTVRVCVTDEAANTGSSVVATIVKDTTPPAGLTLDQPLNGSNTGTTPTFSGGAGSATGDSTTVTVNVYSGGSATGTPVQTLNPAAVSGAYSVAASPALAAGSYTAQAEQKDSANNVSHSLANSFTAYNTSGIIYVNAANTGAAVKNGQTWATAYTDLQTALATANPSSGVVEIWVAASTSPYTPTLRTDPGDARTATFTLRNNVPIYGGFLGNEPGTAAARNARDWAANVTILSGDLGTDGHAYHVVTAPAGTTAAAVLDGFTISGGAADVNGGGLLVNGSPALSHLKVDNNSAAGSGGGMALDNSGSLALSNVTFSNNTAGADGGGLAVLSGTPTLNTVTFGSNTATGNGGGLAVLSGTPTLNTVTFSSNTATGNGGGLYLVSGNPSLTSVTFTGNGAASGGGLYVTAGDPTLSSVTFTGNTATVAGGGMYNGTGSPSVSGTTTFTGNTTTGTGKGAGMYNASGSPTLTGVTFGGTDPGQANATDLVNGYGGGMYSNGGNPRLTSVTFGKNAAANGGGLSVNNGNPTLSQVTFDGNTAAYSGGGLYSVYGSPALSRVTFTGNTVSNGYGGGLYNTFGSPTLVNVGFRLNTASVDGGGLTVAGGRTTLTNVTFSGNSAGSHGGAAYVSTTLTSALTLTNCVLWDDTAPYNREIYTLSASAVNITYSDVYGGYTGTGNIDADPKFVSGSLDLQAGSGAIDKGSNTASGLTGVTTDILGRGRFHDDPGIAPNVVPPAQAPVDMGAYEFQGATAISAGRLYVNKNATTGSHTGGDWANAFTELSAALLAANPDATNPTVEIWVAAGTYKPSSSGDVGATFTLKNNVKVYGGFAGGEANLTDRNPDPATNGTVLSGNVDNDGILNAGNSHHVVTAPSGTDSTAMLGGFTIADGNADWNSGGGNGGGVLVNGSPTLTNLILSGNASDQQGGGLAILSGTPALSNLTFSGNASGYCGGGMYVQNGTQTLSNAVFASNTATYSGGGLCLDNDANAQLKSVTFSGNSASDGGGLAIYYYSTATLVNVVFSGNTASGWGGGMYVETYGVVGLTNVTMTGNTAGGGSCGGGGIYVAWGAPTITNSILWGNTSTSCSTLADQQLFSWDAVSVTYSNVQGGYTGTGNIDADPKFVYGGLDLSTGSPAIDKGDNAATNATGVTIDILGRPRFHDDPGIAPNGTPGPVDMGAYEFQGGSLALFHVKATGGSDGNDCLSWDTACATLQGALAKAKALVLSGGVPTGGTAEIRVAAGTYKPSAFSGGGTNTRDYTFELLNNVVIYGGYPAAGGDTRDWVNNTTILSGDLLGNDASYSTGDNAYHVVLADNVGATAVLDGFTITSGYADAANNSPTGDTTGGGILVQRGSPTLRNLKVQNNYAGYGGGLGIDACDRVFVSPGSQDCTMNLATSPTLTDVTLSGNRAYAGGGGAFIRGLPTDATRVAPTFNDVTFQANNSLGSWGGGGVYAYEKASPVFNNVTFRNNIADAGAPGSATNAFGGGYGSYDSKVTITGGLFEGNTGKGLGGGMYLSYGGESVFTDVTFTGNTAYRGESTASGGGIYIDNGAPTLTNLTVSGNQAIDGTVGNGGGIYAKNVGSGAKWTDLVVTGNKAGYGAGIYSQSGSGSQAQEIV
ncbi:MAG: choice-of-anchor Q domain-containing protein, partial [Chloroflexota bacterium]